MLGKWWNITSAKLSGRCAAVEDFWIRDTAFELAVGLCHYGDLLWRCGTVVILFVCMNRTTRESPVRGKSDFGKWDECQGHSHPKLSAPLRGSNRPLLASTELAW